MKLLSTFTALWATATAHSWPEQTRRLAPNGAMVGKPGFDRAHFERGQGPQEDWLIPPNGRPGGKIILPDDKLVKPSQRQLTDSSYSAQFPMLKAAPGDFVAILYTENGHVTRPEVSNPLKPINRGTVYLYATTHNDLSEANLVDVHLKWTTDGTGGDGKGRLLATRNYDDGQCHEPIPAVGDTEGISTYRTKFITNSDSLICQSDVQIPTDATVGQILTVIWVWDWPDMSEPGVAVPPASYYANSSDSGQPYVTMPEIYTGVVDFEIVDPCDDSLGEVKGPTCQAPGLKNIPNPQDVSSMGIAAQMNTPFQVQVPQAGTGVSEATADASNIPLRGLIGLKTKLPFPLPSSILQGQGQGQSSPTINPVLTSTGTTQGKPLSTSTTSAGNHSKEQGEGVLTVTVTVTVPESTATATVTVAPKRTSIATGPTRPSLPKATQLLPSGYLARRRRAPWA